MAEIYIPSIAKKFETVRTCLGQTWLDSQTTLATRGLRIPEINEFKEFIKYLYEKVESGAPDCSSNDIKTIIRTQLFAPITVTPGQPNYIGTFLDAKFGEITSPNRFFHKNNRLSYLGGYKLSGTSIQPSVKSEEVNSQVLMKERSIDFTRWLKGENCDIHGMPLENSRDGYMDYRFPENGRVGLFFSSNTRDEFDTHAFLFDPDLSCRFPGRSRLGLDLSISPSNYNHPNVGAFAVKD
ncbi:MAG: hypothetical protein WC867_08535 [Candidatus Pacearchaeota archaeon]|jgi:hypothetical protein